jgi:hypothetical protein
MSGYQVAPALRACCVNPVHVRGERVRAAEDVTIAAAAGFDGHVAKPVDLERVERLLIER